MPITLSVRHRRAIRDSACFLCLASQHFWTDPLAQAQVAYAHQLGKPFRVLLLRGTRVPEDAFQGVTDLQIVPSRGAEADVRQVKMWMAELAERS